jgi:spore germination protein YaaH
MKIRFIFLFLFLTIISLAGLRVYLALQQPLPRSELPGDLSTIRSRPAATPTPRPPLLVKASIPYWDQRLAVRSFQDHVEQLDIVSLFWYYLTDDGLIRKYQYAQEDASIISFAHENGVQVTAVITNLPEEAGSSWDSGRVERMLVDRESRARHIADITEKLESLGFDGVTIDYEGVVGGQRENFTLFIQELAAALHRTNKLVGVALHPKTGEPSDYMYDFQDWVSLAAAADHLYIMAYGEHWDGGEPGPIASYGWVERIVRYASSLQVPKNKLFLGIPLYGYDWAEGSTDATGLTYSDVGKLIARYSPELEWDSNARSPHFHYVGDRRDHEVWFENARSVGEKIRLADEVGLAGVAFWRLGGEDPKLWETIPQEIQTLP